MSTPWKRVAIHRPADNQAVYFRLAFTRDVISGWFANEPAFFWELGGPGGGGAPRVWPTLAVLSWRPRDAADGGQWHTIPNGAPDDGTDCWINPLWPSYEANAATWNDGENQWHSDGRDFVIPPYVGYAWTPR